MSVKISFFFFICIHLPVYLTFHLDIIVKYLIFQSLPKTTYQDHTEQIYLRDDFEEQETKKAMVTMKTIANTDLDRYLLVQHN